MPARLSVLRATGVARTGLAAFHRALAGLGLGHYNLVRLSSVIPPGTQVAAGRPAHAPGSRRRWSGDRPYELVDGQWGDRLYCVYAERRAEVVGEEAWAGLGWIQRRDGLGGYFVEHDGTSPGEVELAISRSLADMVADEAGEFEAPEWVLEGAVCEDDPVCVLVVVPYAVLAW